MISDFCFYVEQGERSMYAILELPFMICHIQISNQSSSFENLRASSGW